MGRQVLIAETKPGIWIEKKYTFEEVESLRAQAPSSFVVGYAREIVDERVDVRTDGQTVQPEIIPDIPNICERAWFADGIDTPTHPASSGPSANTPNPE